MRSEFQQDPKIVRIKTAYWLNRCARGQARESVEEIQRAIELRDPKRDHIFERVVKLLEENGIDDFEGYVRYAFVHYGTPYLNALLSPKLVQLYKDNVEDAIHRIHLEYIYGLHSLQIKLAMAHAKTLEGKLEECLPRLGLNPILECYIRNTYRLTWPDEDLYMRACVEYLIWPLAYERSPQWAALVRLLNLDGSPRLPERMQYVHKQGVDSVCTHHGDSGSTILSSTSP